MEGKLIKVENGYLLIDVNTSNEDRWSVIGSYPFNKDVEKLSLKNCQAIENGYDLDELALDYYKLVFGNTKSYKDGFKKAIELLGDKKFSEEDIKKTLYLKNGFDKDGFSFYKSDEEIIQSLQQTEWDVSFNPDEKDTNGCLILKRK